MRRLALLLSCLVVCAVPSIGAATPPPPTSAPTDPPPAESTTTDAPPPDAIVAGPETDVLDRRQLVEEALAAIAAQTAPDEAANARREVLQRILEAMSRVTALREQRAAFEASTARADADRAALQQSLEDAASEAPPDAWAEMDADQLADVRSEFRGRKTAADAASDAVAEDEAQRSARREAIPAQSAEARAELTELTQQLGALEEQDDELVPRDERRLLIEATMAVRRERLLRNDAELLNYDARREILALRRQVADREVALVDRRLIQIEDRLDEVQTAAAQQLVDDAIAAARANRPLPLQRAAARNVDLGLDLAEDRRRRTRVLADQRAAEADLDRWTREFASVDRLVENIGLTADLGSRLRAIRDQLPSVRELDRDLDSLTAELSRVTVRRGDLQDEADALANRFGEQTFASRVVAAWRLDEPLPAIPGAPLERDDPPSRARRSSSAGSSVGAGNGSSNGTAPATPGAATDAPAGDPDPGDAADDDTPITAERLFADWAALAPEQFAAAVRATLNEIPPPPPSEAIERVATEAAETARRFSDQSMAALDPDERPSDEQRRDAYARVLVSMLEALQVQRRESYVVPSIEALDELSSSLTLLIQEKSQLLASVRSFRNYIDERILWIGNVHVVRLDDGQALVKWARTMLDIDSWTTISQDVRAYIASHRLWTAFGLVFLIAYGAGFPAARRVMREMSERARRPHIHGYRPTAIALGLVLYRALLFPLVFLFLASLLAPSDQTGGLALWLAIGLRRAAAILVFVEFLRIAWRPNGLFERHFGWRTSTGKIVRRHLRWSVPLIVPLAIIIAPAATESDVQITTEQLVAARAAFFVAMIIAVVLTWGIVHPSGSFVGGHIERHAHGWIGRLRVVWFGLLLLLPVVLAIFAALGYLYSALQIETRLVVTIVLLVVALVVYAALLRWLLVIQRRLALEQAKRKREAAIAELRKQKGKEFVEGEVPVENPDEIDVAAISAQSKSLLRVSMAALTLIAVSFVWAEVVPAFGRLDDITLWTSGTNPVEAVTSPLNAVTGGDGGGEAAGEATTSVDPLAPESRVSLADFFVSILFVIGTVLVGKNLPGLLEIAVLPRLPISPGGRYAISTIVRYVVIILGLVLAFNAIGIGWGKVQFLAAAVTVGLGFGLQEIFANFVSGLILLFERPIRVGDVVTVNNTSGTVSRIRMRATTIVDWDRKELIIPNKAFVTGEIVNWSLTDSVVRVLVPVGVAYGSDTRLVHQTLLNVAAAHDKVLKDPPPRAWFLAFGASSLDFRLQVFVSVPDQLLLVGHELRLMVDDAFRKEGIEISFPQQDLHLRSVDETAASHLAAALAGSKGAVPADVDATPPGADVGADVAADGAAGAGGTGDPGGRRGT